MAKVKKRIPFEPFETMVRAKGFVCIAGLDEAGRGCLAGPVVAAAVVLPEGCVLPGLGDSKQLTASRREKLVPLIHEMALGVGIGVGSLDDIDSLNILHASLLAMKRAVLALPVQADYLLVDGNQPVKMDIPQDCIVKGDSRSQSIAAASIIAKVHRDQLMVQMATAFPGYGFDVHKGYGTVVHREAIKTLGPCPIHRRTFKGVREYLGGLFG